MITMKNIHVKDNQILVDCYKEGCEDGYFSLVIDASTYEIISSSLDRPSIYARQAVLKIKELCENCEELPKEAKAIWC